MLLQHRRALVTGADGFIGSHLVERLVREGSRVRALVQYNSFNSWGWLEDSPILSDVEVVAGDIRDPGLCVEMTRDMEVVFHLAALIPIPYSYKAPASYVDTNVRGTLNLCQSAVAAGVEKFVQVSSSEVYGTAQYVPIDERHPLSPQSPYSASKIGADAIAGSFWYSFQLPIVLARPFNTYGPRQSARAVIPTIISQLASNDGRVQLGDLTTTRDFTYVEDTCDGLLAVAGLDSGFGEAFNIGSNHEITIADLVTVLGGIMQIEPTVTVDDSRRRPEASEVRRLRCDNRKLELACGFRPGIALDQGLSRTVAWFADPRHRRHYKAHLYNV
jgi:NAD dependent epimerase/dehydratase